MAKSVWTVSIIRRIIICTMEKKKSTIFGVYMPKFYICTRITYIVSLEIIVNKLRGGKSIIVHSTTRHRDKPPRNFKAII